jgi:oligopeptide/dipeptide ABC transporter ATP-binding protein
MQKMHPPLLQVSDLTTRIQIGKKMAAVVDQLSFTLEEGRSLAIVGESGCGKTMSALSLMRILPQLPPFSCTGNVLYKGQNLLHLSEKAMRSIRGGRIAMIFQDPSSALNPVYKVGTQLMEAVELHLKLSPRAAFKRVVEALREVGIAHPEERVEAYPHQLSGGMKQRIMIAMALLCEPDLLIADEPTTALDVTIQAEVLNLIRALQKKKGTALLLITHDMGIVAEVADQVLVMYAAQAIEMGSVLQIFDQKAHPYTQGLFASRAAAHQPKQLLHAIKGSVPSPGSYPSGCRFHPRCPYRMPKCERGEVPLFQVGEKHHVKCWLHDQSPESTLQLEKFYAKTFD